MAVLPPGTLLQLMYLRERLLTLAPGRFIEVGPGSGEITGLLLDLGWRGVAYELDAETVNALATRFAEHICAGRLRLVNDDFLSDTEQDAAQLVISSMVMEHLDDAQQASFMARAAAHLCADGVMIALVPASPEDWGVEDDIAGHWRRYTRAAIGQLMDEHNWRLRHIVGLTYPISNFLLPLSNFLVRRSEAQKVALSAAERTKLSGRRKVRYKTHFPMLLGLLLNKVTMYPLYRIQKVSTNAKRALVLFVEAQPPPTLREP